MNIAIEHASKRFGTATALADVSLEIGSGEIFFLLGPSGCGKTTLLRAIAGFQDLDSGCIRFDGRDVTGVPPHERNTGMMFQGYALWPHLTVAENVAFGLEMRKLGRAEREERTRRALERVRITDLAARKPNQLSGGQQQRVALARTLVIEPACLLLDEPLANLDAKLRLEMRTEIRRLCKESGLTAVYVTHDQKEALSIADCLAVMDSGRVLQVGAPRQVYTRPASAFVAEFIGETNFIPATVRAMAGTEASLATPAGLLTGRAASGLAVGAKVMLSVRPEAVTVVRSPQAASANRLEVTVREVTYLGGQAQYAVATLAGDIGLNVTELNPPADVVPGQRLTLSIAPVDVTVLPPAS